MTMLSFQMMRMRAEYMMELLRQDAVRDTIEKFKAADRHYYETCEGGAEVTRLIKVLEDELGVDPEYIFELDWNICEEASCEEEA